MWSSGQDFLPPRGYASYLPEGTEALLALNASGVELSGEVEDTGLFTSYHAASLSVKTDPGLTSAHLVLDA